MLTQMMISSYLQRGLIDNETGEQVLMMMIYNCHEEFGGNVSD